VDSCVESFVGGCGFFCGGRVKISARPTDDASVDVLAFPGATRVSHRSGHRRCARCGKVVSRRAIVCRRCGKKQRVNPRTAMLFVSGLFLIGLFAVATVGPRLPFARGRAHAAVIDWSPPVAVSRDPSIPALSAAELWTLYNLDVVKADARFKNKMIDVTGRVADVRRDYHGDVLLRLATGEALETVRASVINHDDSGRTIPVRGQTVSLRCRGGGHLIGSPELEACLAL
jgi:putative nucleic acid binding protein